MNITTTQNAFNNCDGKLGIVSALTQRKWLFSRFFVMTLPKVARQIVKRQDFFSRPIFNRRT